MTQLHHIVLKRGFIAVLKASVASVATVGLLASGSAFGRDPLNEQAAYGLDHSMFRTSMTIRGGAFNAAVAKEIVVSPDVKKYQIDLGYDLDVAFAGHKKGVAHLNVAAEYFTPEFMEKLRVDKHFESAELKIKYDKIMDTKTLEGVTYKNCDRIYLYDIEITTDGKDKPSFLTLPEAFLQGLDTLEGAFGSNDGFKDLTIWALVHPSIPALGAAKIDMAGSFDGHSFKAGADYKNPNR